MSDYELHKGTLRRLKVQKSKKELILEYLSEKNEEIPSYYNIEEEDDINEYFMDLLSENYIEYNNIMYIIENKEIDSDSDIFECEETGNGIYSYRLSYYNGGCGFEEALETALENKVSKRLTKDDIKLNELENLWKDLDLLSSIGEWKSKVKEFKETYNLTDKEAISIANKTL